MKTLRVLIFLALAGCSSSPPAATPETPLTVEQWKALPTQIKYEVETLEQLKLGNPKLQEPREWERFSRDVLLPSKRKDKQ